MLVIMHLCFPLVQVLGHFRKLTDGVFFSGFQHAPEIFNPLGHSLRHLTPLLGSLGTLVKGGSEALTDLPHTATKLISLEEQDEDEFVLEVSL